MKQRPTLRRHICALLIGLLIGGPGGYKIAKPSSTQIKQANKQAPQPTQIEKNPYDGSNLTLVEMYDSLQQSAGSDFDHRLLMYEQAIRQNEIGMLRMAKEKSTKDPMRKYAAIQMDQSDLVVKMLFEWQSQWGYSHH